MKFYPSVISRTEALYLRLFLVLAVLYSLWTPSKYTRLEDASGLASWGLPVTWIGQSGVHPWFLVGVGLAGTIYVLGVRWPRWLTPLGLAGMTWLHLSYWTLANSQGNTFHGSQMTTFVLLAQCAGWAIMRLRAVRQCPPTAAWPQLDGVLLYVSQCAIAGVYVTSAITKIFKSHGRWLWDSRYFAKSVQKVWRQLALDNPSLDKFSGTSPWATWLAAHPMATRALFAPGFFLELLAFLMLWNRAWAAGLGLALVLMHVGIGIIMQLYFPEFELLVLIFAVNVPYWWLRLRARRLTHEMG